MVSSNSFKITIVRQKKPISHDINNELQWFSYSLGMFNSRDKEKSCFRVFIELLKSNREGKILSSDKIAERSNLTRGTVIHHINKLIEAGLVKANNNRYMLRVDNLENLVAEIEHDLYSTLNDIKRVAKELDKELELV